jgi:phosphoserine phosphatase
MIFILFQREVVDTETDNTLSLAYSSRSNSHFERGWLMEKEIQVICLDLDGVLFDGPSAAYPLAKQLGLGQHFLRALQVTKEKRLPFHDAIVEGAKIWTGIAVDGEYDHLVETLPLMEGAEETVSTLKSWNYEVGCITSGVSQFFMTPFIKRLDLDFGYTNILGEENGAHDGTVKLVMDGPMKAVSAKSHLDKRGVSTDHLAAIGDGENDIDLFKISAFSIAFNPENELVSNAATTTIESKNLRDILPYFESKS